MSSIASSFYLPDSSGRLLEFAEDVAMEDSLPVSPQTYMKPENPGHETPKDPTLRRSQHFPELLNLPTNPELQSRSNSRADRRRYEVVCGKP
jgi:hypothetical protein